MRYALLKITPSLLVQILRVNKEKFRGTIEVIENGLPLDTKIIDINLEEVVFIASQYQHNIIMKLESKSFKDIKKGEVIPILIPPVIQIKRG